MDGRGHDTARHVQPPYHQRPEAQRVPRRQRRLCYGARYYPQPGEGFADRRNEAVICTSHDGGRTWSDARVVPMRADCLLEVAHGALALSSGRLLAPAATHRAIDRLGVEVLVAISDDGGITWPMHSVAFHDPEGRYGYHEQKLAEIAPGRVMAVSWTSSLDHSTDYEDSFAISDDGGSDVGPRSLDRDHGADNDPCLPGRRPAAGALQPPLRRPGHRHAAGYVHR